MLHATLKCDSENNCVRNSMHASCIWVFMRGRVLDDINNCVESTCDLNVCLDFFEIEIIELT